MTVTTQHDLAAEPDAARQARHWTRAALQPRLPATDDAAELIEDIVLCISELVSNAYQAGCAHMRLHCALSKHTIRLSLSDDAPGQPQFGPLADPSQPSGRGLHIVSTLAQRCTITTNSHGPGKQIWLEFHQPERHTRPGIGQP